MKGSLIILLFFVVGVVLGFGNLVPEFILDHDFSSYILYGLMFLVGIGIGLDKQALKNIRQSKLKIFLVPLSTWIGTFAGCALVGLFLQKWGVINCMAVGSGFGYYSLSSIFITRYKGAELGTIALVSNIIRELFTLLAAPFLVKYFGKLAPISSGGATTMDTTLPVITKYSGNDYAVISIFHGFLVDLSVPFLVTFLCMI